MTQRDIIAKGARLADGQWHRLHPASPVLKGGFALLAIAGVIIVNIRDILINIVIGGGNSPGDEYDPLVWIYEHEFGGLIALALLAGIAVFVAGFYVSWRMHRFRITDEQVEVQSGILFRTNRRGRLDRIQGINVSRPLLARVFGAARLEISVAGQNANVQLAYLGSAAADELRREILLRASGTESAASEASPAAGGVIGQRVSELLAPELDPNAAPPESVVQMHLGRLIGSLLLSGFTVVLIGGVFALIAVTSTTGKPFFLLGFVPGIIGWAGFYVSRFTRSLRYTIASTPDGIRVGFGLLSTTNETLPPGRIHAVQVSQPLLWRPAGWWEIKINRASHSSTKGAAGQANTTILPVGNLADARKVLELVLPGLVDTASIEMLERGMSSRGGDDGFTNSPPRARIIRWFSWRRNGFAIVPGAVMFRRGAIWRELVVVPQARLQSLGMHQGPLTRFLRLASLNVHTVAGPVIARLGAIDEVDAVAAFAAIESAAVSSAEADTSHRWRATMPRTVEPVLAQHDEPVASMPPPPPLFPGAGHP